MKPVITFILILSTLISSNAQTLFSFGKNITTKAEFIKALSKNLNNKDKKAAIEEYLPLYINYKLKVKDAYDKKLDTLPTQKAELENFKVQLQENYITEKSNAEALVKEAVLRGQKDIHTQHLFIQFEESNVLSIVEAEQKIKAAYNSLKQGKDFGTVVAENDSDPENVKLKGDIGWITSFSLPYKYETPLYNLAAGMFTEPIRGSNGFHIFKKIAERKALGIVKIAQILLPIINGNEFLKVKEQADKLYDQLQKGASFDALAKEFSLDRTSNFNGGLLPEFGIGTYEAVFENQAFGLGKIGDIAKPFQTLHGYHIIKLIEKNEVPFSIDGSLNPEIKTEEKYLATVKQKVLTDNRISQAKNDYIKGIMPKLGYKNAFTSMPKLWQHTDSVLIGKGEKVTGLTAATNLFNFAKQKITIADWDKYILATRFTNDMVQKRNFDGLYSQFTQIAAEDYLKNNLADYDEGFKSQLQEFKDANLLFEAMDKNVWTKASEDAGGLEKFYNVNKLKYKWAQSANVVLVTVNGEEKFADSVRNLIDTNIKNWRKTTAAFGEAVVADSGRYEISQLPITSTASIQKNKTTPIVKLEQSQAYNFCYVINTMPAGDQREFEDARGFVINDYQNVLEEKWLKTLKTKYPVVVNKGELAKLISE